MKNDDIIHRFCFWNDNMMGFAFSQNVYYVLLWYVDLIIWILISCQNDVPWCLFSNTHPFVYCTRCWTVVISKYLFSHSWKSNYEKDIIPLIGIQRLIFMCVQSKNTFYLKISIFVLKMKVPLTADNIFGLPIWRFILKISCLI